jgi:hypothetical protein
MIVTVQKCYQAETAFAFRRVRNFPDAWDCFIFLILKYYPH